MSDLMKIDIKKIDDDPSGIQPRTMLNGDLVKRYAEQIEDGASFPPIRLWDIEEKPGGKFRISDGYHRMAAMRSIGRESVTATVHVGSMTDCVADAIKMNSLHGQALSQTERYSAMLSYLGMVAESDKPMPSIAFLHDMAGVTRAVAKRALQEFKASPAAEPDFSERSPADQIAREVLTQGCVNADEVNTPPKPPQEPTESIYSQSKATAEKQVHDGKVVSANLRNAITAMVKAYGACEKCEAGVYFTEQRPVFEKYVTTLRRMESACRPERVCACEGQGCDDCKGYGWLSGHQAGVQG